MIMEVVRLFLPVIWALVGTLIGLVLYRSSSAFFEQVKRKNGAVRKVRLVGSICIAAVVYLGLWRATPTSLQTGVPDDSKLVPKQELRAAVEALEQAVAAVSSVEGCAAAAAASKCQSELATLRARTGDSLARARKLEQ
jgi:hypothetical protein